MMAMLQDLFFVGIGFILGILVMAIPGDDDDD
jgi:hypothetical protein